MVISLKFNTVLYWPGEKEEAKRWEKLGYVLIIACL